MRPTTSATLAAIATGICQNWRKPRAGNASTLLRFDFATGFAAGSAAASSRDTDAGIGAASTAA
jgi:hypothetical protein